MNRSSDDRRDIPGARPDGTLDGTLETAAGAGLGTRLGRRDFLRSTALGVGLGLWPGSGRAEAPEEPRVRRRVRLGRTGLEISDISFGSSRLRGDVDLVRHALDRGINYFDSAESYTGGASEETLGRALEGVRDRVLLTSKVKCEAHTTRAELMEALEGSLRRLRTDRVDVYFNHAVNDLDRLRNPEWSEFTSRARQQGKIRFTGMSGHGGRLVECVDYALDHDLADVLLVAFNFGQDPAFHQKLTRGFDFVAIQPDLPRVLARARQKDVGVVAMKTLRGGRLQDLRPYEGGGATFAQAAFRWVLSSPDTDALVVTMKSREQVDEYLGASGWQRSALGDLRLLARYEALEGSRQCRYGCDACAASCPSAVPISDVLRARMYGRDYGDLEQAREAYRALGGGAEACLGCASRDCAAACPFGLRIDELTGPTHAWLAGGR